MNTDQLVVLIAVIAAAAALVSVIVRNRGRTHAVAVDHTRLLALKNEWCAPAELMAASTPREVRLTRSARVMLALVAAGIVGFAIAGVLLLPGVQRDLQDNDLVRREGITGSATISAHRMIRGRSASYHVTYAYDAGNRQYAAEARVTRRDYERFAVGSTVAIHYAPSRPELSRMDDARYDPPQLRLLVFLPILFLLIAPFGVMRVRRLLAWGTPVGAVVTRVSPTKGGTAIRYQFLDPGGDAVTGSDVVPSRGEVKAGDVITVVFDPDRPRRKARYPMAMVKVAE